MEDLKKNQETEQSAGTKIPGWKKFFLILPGISRSSYVLRAVAGGYVAYLGGNNLLNLSSTESGSLLSIGILSAVILFCGAHLLFSGVYALIKGEYE